MPRADLAPRATRGLGELFLTAGVVIALYTVYELYGTNVLTEHAQQAASAQLHRDWSAAGAPSVAAHGRRPHRPDPHSRVRARLVLHRARGHRSEGARPRSRPLHAGTPLPGKPGNVAIAGHRVGRGAPFDGLVELHSCDPIIVETRDTG